MMSEELLARIAELEAKVKTLEPAPYVPQLYPAHRYHAVKPSIIVQSADEDAARAAEGYMPHPQVAAVVQYPAYYYHAQYAPRLIGSADEAAALGEGWSAAPIV